MRGPFWSVSVLLVGAALAGCVEGPADDAGLTADESGAPLSRGSIAPALDQDLPLLSPAVDPWGAETTKVLYEGTVDSGQCYDLATAWELVWGQYVMLGCGEVPIPEGALILPGTKRVHITADATGATVQGTWLVYFATNLRDHWTKWNGPCKAEKLYAMDIDLSPDEWDPPTTKRTHTFAGDWGCDGGVSGPVKFRITLERDPKWEPRPVVDAWQLPEEHKMVGPGVMNLLDHNATWTGPSGWNLEGASWPEEPRLKDLVPPGTKQVSLVVQYGAVQGCPETFRCAVVASTTSWGKWSMKWTERKLATEGGYYIYVYDVPDQITEDSPYSTLSGTRVHPFHAACDPADCKIVSTIGCPPCGTRTSKVRFVVDAWHDTADLNALKARLQIG